MTTDQRERTERGGFRLPWGHERRSDSETTNEPTASGDDAASWVLRAGATTESADGTQVADEASEASDAGEQAAGEAPTASDASAADQADGAEDADGADDPRAGLAWPATDVRRDAEAQPENGGGQVEPTDGEDAEPPVDQADSQNGEADAGADAALASDGHGDADAVAGADEPVAAEESEPSAVAGADSPERQTDAPSMPSSMPPSLAAALSASGSRPTAFLKELTKAMQAAAATARDEAIARLAEDAKRRTDEMQEAGTTRAARLRKSSEEDVTATREWSKAEIARIRDEAEERIAERKARLESELEQHADLVKRRTEQVHEVVEAHEHELAVFIDQLMAEDDPTRIATLAQHLPETPTLPVLDPDDDTAVEETAEASSEEEMAGTPTAAASEDGDARADTGPGADTDGEAATESTMDQLTAEFAEAAEAEALADLDGDDRTGWLTGTTGKNGSKGATATDGIRTELLVTGLSSVAGIAGFKRELSRMDGVHAVAVSAGQAGDFIFAVTHTADLDLAAGIASITSFQAAVHDQQEETLLVSATEPDAE